MKQKEKKVTEKREYAIVSVSHISKADNIVTNEFCLTKKFSGYCEGAKRQRKTTLENLT
jgi:hypothetical protein